jgi:hypothetical protein
LNLKLRLRLYSLQVDCSGESSNTQIILKELNSSNTVHSFDIISEKGYQKIIIVVVVVAAAAAAVVVVVVVVVVIIIIIIIIMV